MSTTLTLCERVSGGSARPRQRGRGTMNLAKLVLAAGELAALHVGAVPVHGIVNHGLQIGVLPDEPRDVAAGDAEQVVRHQHLAVAMRSRANADRRNFAASP